MLDIERYTGIRCPRIHLQLYNAIMHGHELDEAHMIMLFPLLLSGATQRWFASLDPSRRRCNASKIPYNFYNNFIIYSRYELSQTWVFPGKLINCEM